MGGISNVQCYDISKDIDAKKRDFIPAVNCDMVAPGCPVRMIQVSDMLLQCGDNIPVKHFIELYAESLS